MATIDHDVKESTLENTQEPSGRPGPEPAVYERSRQPSFLGGVWLVVTAVSASLLAFGIATAFVDPRSRKALTYRLLVLAVLAGLSFWAGIRRRPHWEFFLAGSFAIVAAFYLAHRLIVSGGGRFFPVFSKAQLIAVFTMAALAIASFLLGLARRRKVAGFSGRAWLVVAAVSTFQVAFNIALAFIEPRNIKAVRYTLPVYAVLAGFAIWAGIKRQPRWEFFLAGSFAVLAAMQLPSRITPPAGWWRIPSLGKAQLITIIVMAVLALVCLLLGIVRRRRAAGASPP